MFRGLRKVFSKGHSSEVGAVEGQQWDEPVVVRPKSKSVISSGPPGDVTCGVAEATTRVTATPNSVTSSNAYQAAALSNGGKAAWSLSDHGESVAPTQPRTSAKMSKVAVTAPSPASAGAQNQYRLAASAGPVAAQPQSAGSAWATPSTPMAKKDTPKSASGEKESGKHHSRISGLFRSGSKNARNSVAKDSTMVEAMVEEDECSDVATGHTYPCARGNVDDGIELGGCGGGLRAGPLVAAPQTL